MRRFLIVGRTGVGKSSFINAVFGTEVAPVDAFKSCTKVVEYYTYKTAFGDVCLLDTPGLSENTLATDLAYLQLIQEAIARNPIEVLLYITPLSDNRFRPDEKRALKQLLTYLGTAVWQNAWIVFTFAGEVPFERLQEAMRRRHQDIASFLRQVGSETSAGQSFTRFQKIFLIDNVVAGWHPEAAPVTSIFT